MALPPKWYQFLVGVFASLGSVLYGYDLGIIAEVVASKAFLTTFNNPQDNETGAVVSVFTGGAFFGSGLAGPVGDYLGRKKTIFLGAVIFLFGGSLQTGAQNLGYLYAGRAIAGLGVGFLVMIVPLYQAELSHPSIRGTITSLQQFMLGFGALIAGWGSYGYLIHFADDDNRQWRIGLGIQLIPAFFLALLILLFPESPRWLISHNRPEDGLQTLAVLHSHGDTSDPWVRAEFDQIQEQVAIEAETEAKSYLELFKNKSSFRRLFIACSLQASVQMTGVSAIQYYSPRIYAQIGISNVDTFKYQGISSIIALFAQFLCMVFIDYTGRRWPLILGNLANMVTFIIATVLIAQFPPGSTSNGAASWGFIAMTWLYNFSFSCTCGPLSWIIPAEMFDTRTRAKGVSIATMTSFAFNTMIGQTTGVAMTNIGYRWYYLFIVCNFTNALFFWAILPETAKRPLEEMDYLFTHAPLFVPGMKKMEFEATDLERRADEVARKTSVDGHHEDVEEKI
ncbi:MFS putative major facilitator superfamily transporter [Aulographum hederae CBS 113979]|uniref:MFS putative major facilitator superfamily transporter n=1 Tax=Aulographum hederae CBS 113979 TaxID=1176131 RepID=A0A6G1HFI8_9PEZI|nr:MFS putative major facilitator superfamily transporter [Aulographum hederae CBS 113979]